MKTITVNTSSEYRVLVGQGLLAQIGTEIRKISNPSKIAIISDSNVWPLYGEIICKHLSVTGFTNIISYTIPAGEQSKNGETFLSLLEFLAENHLTRSDCIIALGGGVVGDLTGFVAGTFLRGIKYVQVPTTLLAFADSSVGVALAIDTLSTFIP